MKTKISDTYIFIICLVLAVGLFLLVYFVPFANVNEEITSLESSNSAMRAHITSLQEYYDNKEQYIADTEVLKKEISNKLVYYPAGYREEDYIMQAVNIDNVVDTDFKQISVQDIKPLATISAATIQQAGIEDYQDEINFFRRDVVYNHVINYDNLKGAIAEIFASPYKINIDSMVYTHDAVTGKLTGTFTLGYYYVTGTGRQIEKPVVPEYTPGTDNIFGSRSIVDGVEAASEAIERTLEIQNGNEGENITEEDNSNADTDSAADNSAADGVNDTKASNGDTGSSNTDTDTSDDSNESGFFDTLTDD